MFYSLILCQGALYLLWLYWDRVGPFYLASLGQDYKIPRKWRYITLDEYLFDTRAKCWRDPASIQGRTISRYAVDLIDSGSWEDNLSGARMLATFIRQGADVRSLLLPSRPRIQKLIDTLGWRAGPSREMRESAARIVAQLAGDIHLAQFPGAIRCISSLLQDEATLTYWWNCDQQQEGRPHLHTGSPSKTEALIPLCEKCIPTRQKREVDQQGGDDDVQQKKHVDDEVGGGCNELILQGLTIFERLALDHQNCLDICSAPGVLPKIRTPLYSATLIQDIKIRDWDDIVNRCFKVLNRLICAPGKIGRRLRREISTNKQAVSNLESILDERNEAGQELQMRAMEILRKLALDLSINLTRETKENLITKQLRIFLADEEGEEPAAMLNPLKATAGRTLVFLSTNSEMNSAIVMSGYNDSFSRLTEKLDAKNNITYRIIAAEILENMCAHCDLDKERVKQTLLPMVLTELQSNKREPLQSGKENQKKSALGDDEENQKKSAPGDDEENQKKSATGNEEQTPAKELQEAFLSLTLVIYDKLTSADDFDEVQKEAPGQGAFVAKLKTIVKENAEATVISLRTVKLCGQIAVSMMRRNHYTEHFKNQGFVESLSQAKKIMSNLESCMLFAGTDLDVKKIDRPLLSELEKEALELVG
ncbi:uncharacterized protein LOC133886183 [Phragmites australis]|uniref:uncharacterized protein LOC133886183 n=1 Tax=Phragmites australis TaxID=29695 RepID=UPI002D796B56|nr:uncharacterized protein LOC133886183 [Phragmites australis]